MRKAIIICLIIILPTWWIWNLYYIESIVIAKPKLHAFLNKNYNAKFKIVSIKKHYSQDLFHEPNGYELSLIDTNSIVLNKIFLQFNVYQKSWITYMGTDIDSEYEKAKNH